MLAEIFEFFFLEDFFKRLLDAFSDENFENRLDLHVKVEELVRHDLCGGVYASFCGNVLGSWRSV